MIDNIRVRGMFYEEITHGAKRPFTYDGAFYHAYPHVPIHFTDSY